MANYRKILFTIFVFTLLPAQNIMAVPTKEFEKFQKDVEALDRTIYPRRFTYQDALASWKIADKFVLTIFNDYLTWKNPYQYFKMYDHQKIGSVDIHLNTRNAQELKNNGNIKYQLGFTLDTPRPNGIFQDFKITVTPLKPDNSLFIIQYNRLWEEDEYPQIQCPGSMRILELNPLNGKFEITVKNEETNFFRQVVLPGKKKFDGYDIPLYDWRGFFGEDGIIKYLKDRLIIEIKYGGCPAGALCYDDITVTCIYKDRHLTATQYVYRQGRYSFDANGEIPKIETVKLAP